MATVTFDFETSIFNKGSVFDYRNKAVSFSAKINEEPTKFYYYTAPDFLTKIRESIGRANLCVFHNGKFDCHWLRRLGLALPAGARCWDTMLAEFILSGQTNSFASLNSLAELYGLPLKHDEVADYWAKGISTEDIPPEIVEVYGNWDVDLTYQVYLKQLDDPRMTDKLKKLILLDGLDLLVLQDMEYNGLKYNKEKSIKLAEEANARIKQIETELFKYGGVEELNFNSDDQLSAFLYGGSFTKDVFTPITAITKSGPNKGKERTTNRFVRTDTFSFDGFFAPLKGTELKKTGIYSSAGDVLKQLKAKTKLQKVIIGLLLERAELDKLSGTYYEGLPKRMEEMQWPEFIHGEYNQVVARTGRLSSSKPNMQNNPPEADALFESRYD